MTPKSIQEAAEIRVTHDQLVAALKVCKQSARDNGSLVEPEGYADLSESGVAVADACWLKGMSEMETAVLNWAYDWMSEKQGSISDEPAAVADGAKEPECLMTANFNQNFARIAEGEMQKMRSALVTIKERVLADDDFDADEVVALCDKAAAGTRPTPPAEPSAEGDGCQTCGVGYYLPSGVCDHCNTPRIDEDKLEEAMLRLATSGNPDEALVAAAMEDSEIRRINALAALEKAERERDEAREMHMERARATIQLGIALNAERDKATALEAELEGYKREADSIRKSETRLEAELKETREESQARHEDLKEFIRRHDDDGRDLVAQTARITALEAALNACGVFFTPLERLKGWNEYKEDAARKRSAALAPASAPTETEKEQ